MRRLATWLAVGFVAALGVAAGVAALVADGDGASAVPPARATESTKQPDCRPDQLDLSMPDIGGDPSVVLRLARAPACDIGVMRISLSIRDRRGKPVLAQETREAFSGVIAPDVEFIGGLTYLPRCDQTGPLLATVRVGPLTASRSLPVQGCLNPQTGEEGQQASALPHCRRAQLALSLEAVGGQNEVALRHVRGRPCRLAHLRLRVFVTDRRGERNELGLGGLDQLGGEFTSGIERIVPFSICSEGAPFVAEARAGPYVARGPAQVGGQNCYSAVRHRVFRFGAKPGVRTATVEALDVTSHPLTIRITLPRRAQIDVWMQETPGGTLDVFDHEHRDACSRRGARQSCVVRFGLLEGKSAGLWTAYVRKLSVGPARVRISFAFEPPQRGY